MFGFAVLSVALMAGQVAASAISTRSPLGSLLRIRQSSFDPSTVPSACRSDCADISAALTSSTCNTDIDCICSSSASDGLYTCLQCALSLQPDEDVLEQAQESYNDYADACASGNAPVSPHTLTIPGGAASASASGAPAVSRTATAAGTRTTAPAKTAAAAEPTETSTDGDDDGDDDDSDSDDTDSDSSSGAQRNGARTGVSASFVGLAGAAAAMVALLAL